MLQLAFWNQFRLFANPNQAQHYLDSACLQGKTSEERREQVDEAAQFLTTLALGALSTRFKQVQRRSTFFKND